MHGRPSAAGSRQLNAENCFGHTAAIGPWTAPQAPATTGQRALHRSVGGRPLGVDLARQHSKERVQDRKMPTRAVWSRSSQPPDHNSKLVVLSVFTKRMQSVDTLLSLDGMRSGTLKPALALGECVAGHQGKELSGCSLRIPELKVSGGGELGERARECIDVALTVDVRVDDVVEPGPFGQLEPGHRATALSPTPE